MRSEYLSIAGFTIELLLHPTEYKQSERLFLSQLFKFYKGFIKKNLNGTVDFTIHIIQEDPTEILKFKNKNYIEYYQTTQNKKSIKTFYSISLEELSQLLKYIIFHLIQGSGFFIHGSVGIHEQKALLFLGDSGKGKSTVLRLLQKKTTPFADDIFIIRRIHSIYYCFQSPYLDKQTWILKQSNGYEIRKVFLLNQAKTTTIEKKSFDYSNKSILRELVSNSGTIIPFTKTVLSFLKGNPVVRILHFRKNKKELFEAITAPIE